MKHLYLAAALLGMVSCSSIESTTVNAADLASNGDAIAVIQAEALGLTAVFHLIDIVQSDLDTVVNKLLIGEAKAMGANKVELKYASTTPRHGIYALFGFIIGVPSSTALGIAVK